MAEECWEKLSPEREEILKVYFATSNEGKIKRAQSCFDSLRSKISVEQVPELVDVDETASTPLECAFQKIEAYKNKGYKTPVMVADTAVYFEDQDSDPTKVRRTAIENAGKNESELSKEEIADLMIEYYSEKARKAGGQIPFHYIDSWVVLSPNGEIQTYEYRREYILTDTHK